MAYKTILVAYDKSEQANRALVAAREFVEVGLADKIVALTAFDPREIGESTFAVTARMAGFEVEDTHPRPDEELFAEVKDAVDAALGDFASEVEIVVQHGVPQGLVLKYAHDHGCDLIVMGSRGLGAIQGLLGSVSQAVLQHADIPVLIIK
ncbi:MULTISPECIES: universal stress protein [unclassified Adlercreutzia]|uniref:universal stress protein n=1 Tax=unclassified Adlercreutzia TaxID=2636013 RepID=UPI0013EA7DDE|nr:MULTISPECIES: universal stress protein [unclassified Adlercreutzia]